MSTQPTVPEPLWTAHQVAEFLQLSLSWVRHATAAGQLPCLRLGHNVRYEPTAIRGWVERQRAQPAKVIAIRRNEGDSNHG